MKRPKLTFRFHNPNPPGVTADYILKIFMEADRAKVDQALENAANIEDVSKKALSNGGRPA